MFYATEIAPQASLSMLCKGFSASLKRAERLIDNGHVHTLPQGRDVPVYPVDMLPGCPDEWLRGQGSYVCPVEPNWGLWFDWTMNDSLNTAVLPSVKGMNPITGQKLEGLWLEAYADKCPVHDISFESHERFCPECNYRWPPQSYVCDPNILWWDGFRQPDGTVRQFFFSEDEARDIASLVIGEKNTVPAFGFAFYSPKRGRVPRLSTTRMAQKWEPTTYCDQSTYFNPTVYLGTTAYWDMRFGTSIANCSLNTSTSARGMSHGSEGRRDTLKRSVAKSVSVGAGAKISQELRPDSLSVKEWKTEPEAIMRLYFCFEEQFRYIVDNGGIKSFKGDDEGFLRGLPVG